jgi:hypothetical protein
MTITIAHRNSDWYVVTNLLFVCLSGTRLVLQKKTMPVPPTKKNRPISLLCKSLQCQLGIQQNVMLDAMSLLYMNVGLMTMIADANVKNQRCGKQLVVHIVFLFYSTVCGQGHLLPHRVPFANLGLVYHQITYCMLGRQTK